MKNKLLLLVITVVVIMTVGCNLEEKISENIVEGVFDKAVGDDVDFDLDDGEMKIKTDDGELSFTEEGYTYEGSDGKAKLDEDGYVFEGEDGLTFEFGGEYKWPEGQAADYIPKLNEGTIVAVYNTDTSCYISFEGIKEKAYREYIETVKAKDFNKDMFEGSSDEWYSYTGCSSEARIAIDYYNHEEQMAISIDLITD